MRANSKHILYTRVTMDKKVHQWPTAVFANEANAKQCAALINVAHQSGNVEMAKSLDPQTKVDDAGKLVPGIKFALVEVPYEPSLSASADDLFAEDRPIAS